MPKPFQFLFVVLSLFTAASLAAQEPVRFAPGSLSMFEPDPEAGFEHPYLIYMPESAPEGGSTYMLVEPNNTGKPSDDFEEHVSAAKHLAGKNSVGHLVSRELGVPLLVPIFPRPMADWKMYTHALDVETIHAGAGPLERLDLQLIAMIDDARSRLNAQSYEVHEQFLMTGFSASGTFINRFVALHPHRVRALAAGGFNSVLFLPAKKLDGYEIKFPIGTSDYKSITGREFDLDAVNRVPQLYFMGEHDTNDAVQFDDGYNADEREAIYAILGEQIQPERWQNCQRVCRELGLEAQYFTAEDIGHGTDRRVIDIIVEFLRPETETPAG
jgi:hypothetical protein